MTWVVVVIVVFVLGTGAVFAVIIDRFGKQSKRAKKVIEVMGREVETKRRILRELYDTALGLVTEEDLAEVAGRLSQAEDALRTEKGKVTITEAEIEAVDLRLRELEELKKELEVSALDATRELEMLRSQQRDIESSNEGLRSQLNTSLEEIDMLLKILATSAFAVEKLTAAKNELNSCQQKIDFYSEQIAVLNDKYMKLKQAYDALDIEYAQLYEKQQASAE